MVLVNMTGIKTASVGTARVGLGWRSSPLPPGVVGSERSGRRTGRGGW